MTTGKRDILIIALLSSLLFIPLIGNVHLFDWDEINFAECSREMIETGDYLRVHIDYEPFWEKPPLFFWFQSASMHLFGINEFAARLPNAIAGVITLILLYLIGNRISGRVFSLFWVIAYAGSILPFFYFKSGIIDPLFNLFMFLAVYYLYKRYSLSHREHYVLFLAGFFAGLAILIKGPVGYLLPFLTLVVFFIIKRKSISFDIRGLILFSVYAAIVSLLWFGAEILTNGTWFMERFIQYQIRLLTTGDAGHSGPIYYHVVVLLIGCFPASILLFTGLGKKSEMNEAGTGMKLWMIILLAVVVIIFSIVKTKILHYSSLAYYPITYLAAVGMYQLVTGKSQWNWKKSSALLLLAFIPSLLFTAIPLAGMFKAELIPMLRDKFVAGNLQADVKWLGFEWIIGLIIFVGTIVSVIYLHKKEFVRGFVVLFGSVVVTLTLFLPLTIPKLEGYIQGAPIEFYQEMSGKDVYVKAIGFRSYADLYYSYKPEKLSAKAAGVPHTEWEKWLADSGKPIHPAYFVTKINEKEKLMEKYPKLRILKEKNGFVFFVRSDSSDSPAD